jgi:glucose-6-phosphate 1-epimerase
MRKNSRQTVVCLCAHVLVCVCVRARALAAAQGALKTCTLKNAGGDSAVVYPFGACVTSYVKGGTDYLCVRPDAKLDGSKPISGGIPHCFPQFGPGAIQQHGFARNLDWEVVEQSDDKIVMSEHQPRGFTRRAALPVATR